MKKMNIVKKIAVFIIIFLIMLTIIIIVHIKRIDNLKKIYFNKPVSWENVYAYIYDESENKPLEELEVFQLQQEKDYIYSIKLTDKIINTEKEVSDYRIIFFSEENKEYEIKTRLDGYNKIYNIVTGLGEAETFTRGEWLNYNKNIKIGKIPTTKNKVKNIILMIGDGMGENHVLAGEIYKGEKLNIQKIENKCYVKTESCESMTDSAAAITALATGNKTKNKIIGKDKLGNDKENLTEYANFKGLKTGVVCTQILNDATPAGLIIHNSDRNNRDEIALSEINSDVNLMLGGGRNYFKKYEDKMKENNYKWINNIAEIKDINKNDKVIGTFADGTISELENRVKLADMTKEALCRLESENGFFLMVEGSDIDTYSHKTNMDKTLTELIDFDDAVKIAKQYVDENSDSLLIVTADHETGGLSLDGIKYEKQLTDDLFKMGGQHTNAEVLVYAYGKEAEMLTKYDVIDNTSIYKFIKQALSINYEGDRNNR